MSEPESGPEETLATLVTDYLDGTLDAAARARFEERVRTDPATSAALVEAQAGRALLTDLPAADPPADFLHRTRRRLGRTRLRRNSAERREDRAGNGLVVAAFVVVLIAAVVTAWYFLQGGS